MLSLFPELFTFAALAPVFLRAGTALTLILVYLPRLKQKRAGGRHGAERITAFFALAGAVLLAAGLLTQLGAAIAALSALLNLKKSEREGVALHLLTLAAALALLVLGPGVIAFDYPF